MGGSASGRFCSIPGIQGSWHLYNALPAEFLHPIRIILAGAHFFVEGIHHGLAMRFTLLPGRHHIANGCISFGDVFACIVAGIARLLRALNGRTALRGDMAEIIIGIHVFCMGGCGSGQCCVPAERWYGRH